ncbi:MAG: cell division protein FtsZ [Thermoplasmata archaeon]|nr:cell division protein FtsZ [Thermoplasmata archaeon]
MKGLLENVLQNKGGTNYVGDQGVDAELAEMLKGLKANIKIFGCGGGGCNTVSRITEKGISGADVYAANTDAQHLLTVNGTKKLLLGPRVTRGLGTGALPQVGEEAAREVQDKIKERVGGANMVFVACGLGGGTGTGAAPYIARLAKEQGALTVAFATLPFKAEGKMRMENAMRGLQRLQMAADTTVVIPNEKILEIAPKLPLIQAFRLADEVMSMSISGLTEVLTKPGLVNLDFNDMRTIMKDAGLSMIGFGESDSDQRADEAVNEALNSPLLTMNIAKAKGVLVNVTGGSSMSVSEAQKVAERIHDTVGPGARIIWGASVDPTLGDTMRVLLVATGLQQDGAKRTVKRARNLDFVA